VVEREADVRAAPSAFAIAVGEDRQLVAAARSLPNAAIHRERLQFSIIANQPRTSSCV